MNQLILNVLEISDTLSFDFYLQSTSTPDFIVKSYNKDTDVILDEVSLIDYLLNTTYTHTTWQHISIPLSDIGFDFFSGNGSIVIQSESLPDVIIFLDNITLTGTTQGTGYANPHAATAINSTTYTYDQNGNLASTTAGLHNTWDYENRLVESQGGGTATTTYTYDSTGQRVSKTSNGTTTYYPFANYEVTGSSTTKHVYVEALILKILATSCP